MGFKLYAVCLEFIANAVVAQNKIIVTVKDKDTKEIIQGATINIKNTPNGGSCNKDGKVEITNIPNGDQTFIISMIGYQKVYRDIKFPLLTTSELTVYLEPESE
jgi:iron complex outermembrane receptor protein